MAKVTSFQTIVFLADGLHISQVEPCETAKEAIQRAEAWTVLGHKAIAVLQVANIETCGLEIYPLS